jgi:hypothetical protein
VLCAGRQSFTEISCLVEGGTPRVQGEERPILRGVDRKMGRGECRLDRSAQAATLLAISRPRVSAASGSGAISCTSPIRYAASAQLELCVRFLIWRRRRGVPESQGPSSHEMKCSSPPPPDSACAALQRSLVAKRRLGNCARPRRSGWPAPSLRDPQSTPLLCPRARGPCPLGIDENSP